MKCQAATPAANGGQKSKKRKSGEVPNPAPNLLKLLKTFINSSYTGEKNVKFSNPVSALYDVIRMATAAVRTARSAKCPNPAPNPLKLLKTIGVVSKMGETTTKSRTRRSDAASSVPARQTPGLTSPNDSSPLSGSP